MIGAFAGDIIGSIYEFRNTKDYNFPLFSEECSYTDDSIMTAAVADWLVTDAGHTHQGLEDRMLMYAQQHPCPMGGYGGGFRTWLFKPEALRDYDSVAGALPYVSSTGRHPYNSWGNGSAMRVSPVGWWARTLEEALRLAKISAEVTHNHPEGIKGAQATAAAVFLARKRRSRAKIREYLEQTFGYDLSRKWEDIQPSYAWDSSCQGTVPEALICALQSTSFEDAIRKAVSMGGDSDTLACITGAVAEALYRGMPADLLHAVTSLLDDFLLQCLRRFEDASYYGKVYLLTLDGDNSLDFLKENC